MTPGPVRGITAADTARVVGALQWAVDRLAGIARTWSAEAQDGATAEWLRSVADALASQEAPIASVLPDSVLLASVAVIEPAFPETASILETLESHVDLDERAGVVLHLLSVLAADCDELMSACADHCDGALIRVVNGLAATVAVAGATGRDPAETLAATSGSVAAAAGLRLLPGVADRPSHPRS